MTSLSAPSDGGGRNDDPKGGEGMSYPILQESTRTEDGYYRHNPCGELLDTMQVSHPVWDKRFTAAGTGEVETEPVPYCETCGPVPSPNGTPVYV